MAGGEDERAPAMTSATIAWPLLARLPAQLAALAEPSAWRDLLNQAHEELKARFFAEEPVEELVHARAALIDAVLREAWRRFCGDFGSWALVAVGGYGRGELHPASDIDILLLVPRAPDMAGSAAVERLVTFLWDIGLEVGHSVRTVAECAEESVGNVSVMTTLLESRLLAGSAELLAAMREALEPGAHLAGEPLLRGQGARADRAAPEGQRHRLQPGTEREDRSRRPARHPDHRLGGQAPLRRGNP